MKYFNLILCLYSIILISNVPRTNSSSLEVNRTLELTTSELIVSVDSDAEMEAEIAEFMRNHHQQRRYSLSYNSILSQLAREKAYDMGRRNYYSHKDPDGRYYYDFYKEVGYESNGGGGECIMASSETAREAWDAWMNSPGHRSILLGLDLADGDTTKFEYGIGHAYVSGSRWGHYWVVIISSPKTSSPKTRRTTVASDDDCSGNATKYPHVIKGTDGKLKPSCGYVWVNSESNDFRVKLMRGLVRTEDGNLLPGDGYRWVRPNDPKDLRVEPIP